MPDKSILVLDESNQVIQLANTDFSAVAETVLEKVVSDAGVATLSSTDRGNDTSIGTFNDIYRIGDPGSASTGTTTVNRTIYQNLHSGSVGSITDLPLEWNSSQGEVKEVDSSYLDTLADDIITYMVENDGPGTYRMSTTAPTGGGTWTEVFNVQDALSTNNNDTPVTKVYVKSSGTLNTSKKLIKADGSSLKAMTDLEVGQLAERVKQRIIDTGVGTYAFSQTAPGTGTWENMGTIDDNYYATQSQNFVGFGPVAYSRAFPYYRTNTTFNYVTYTGSNYSYRWLFYTSGIYNGFYGPNNDTYLSYTGTRVSYGTDYNYYYGGTAYIPSFYVGPGSQNYFGTRVISSELSQETLTLWRRVS